MRSPRTLLTCSAVFILTGLFAQQLSPVIDWNMTPVDRTTGGSWWIERDNFGGPSCRFILADADHQPISGFTLETGNDNLESNIRAFPLPNDELLIVTSEMIVEGFDNIFLVALAILNESGEVLWQETYRRNEGEQPPAGTCGTCTSIEVDEHGRIFVMIPRYLLIEDLLCIDREIGGLVWWKHIVNGTPDLKNMLVADGAGGCYWLLANMKVFHISANGDLDWGKRFTWSDFSMGLALERAANGHLLVYGRLGFEPELGVAELDENGTLVSARTYGPVTSSGYVETVRLSNDHTLIATYDGTFFSVDANGEVVNAYAVTTGVNVSDMTASGERVLVAGRMLFQDPVRFLFSVQENMDDYCYMAPTVITMEEVLPGELDLADETIYLEDVQEVMGTVTITTTPLALPTVVQFCDLVGMVEQRPISALIYPTQVARGEHITVECNTPGTIEVFGTSGARVRSPKPMTIGTNTVDTHGLSAGVHLIRICDKSGALIQATRIIVV